MTILEERPVAEEAALLDDRPTNVIAAVARVMAEIGGIGKMTAQERAKRGLGGGDTGISYAYRGIDQIAAAAQPLLGRYGVVIVPTCILHSRVEQITINNRPWTDTSLRVAWTIYGPGGVEDKITAESEGLGRDNADKGPNKAMTAAHKNLIVRLLMIGDPTSDTDGQTFERDEVPPQPTGPQPLSAQWMETWRKQMTDDGVDPDAILFAAFGNVQPDPLTTAHLPAMRDALARVKEANESPEAPELRHDASEGGTTGADDQPAAEPVAEGRPATPTQIGRIKAEYTRLGYDRDRQLKFTGSIVGRRIDSHNQLTYDEAEKVIEALRRVKSPAEAGDDV